MFEPLPKNLPSQILLHMQKMINEGKLKKGDRLPPERELAQMFKVSRNSLREALGALAAMGILQRKQGGYNIISADDMSGICTPFLLFFKLNGGNVYDIIYFRYILEIQALKIICYTSTQSDLDTLYALLEQAKQTRDFEALLTLDLDFHKEIIRLTNNKLMLYLMQIIYGLIEEQLRASYDSIRLRKDLFTDICQSHENMLHALSNHDATGAIQILAEGFEDSFPTLDFQIVKQCI